MGLSRLACVLLVAWAVGACDGATEPTQVVLVMDTDLQVPAQLDGLDIEVTAPDGEQQQTSSPLIAGTLPRTLALLHEGGALGPFEVRAVGLLGDDAVVVREASFEFVPKRILTLRLSLLASCVGVSCGAAQTCAASGCRGVEVGVDELTVWEGEPDPLVPATRPDGGSTQPQDGGGGRPDAAAPPTSDAGEPADADAGSDKPDGSAADGGEPDANTPCVPTGAETCNGRDDDCDGEVDEDFDLNTSSEHCGQCGRSCVVLNATAVCSGGECRITACTDGFGNCDQDAFTGCETDVRVSAAHCGNCGNACGMSTKVCCNRVCSRDCN